MATEPTTTIDHHLSEIGDALAVSDASEAEAAMCELVASLSLISEIRDLVGAERRLQAVAMSGQLHPNSFAKYVLRHTQRAKLVLHVWRKPENLENVETHNHRWNFVSTVLAGSLRASTLDERATGLPVTEFEYNSPSSEDTFQLVRVGPSRIEVVKTIDIAVGTTYYQPFQEIHRAHVDQTPTVTMIVQGPVLQARTRVFVRAGQTDGRSGIERSVARPTLDQTRDDLLELSDLISRIGR